MLRPPSLSTFWIKVLQTVSRSQDQPTPWGQGCGAGQLRGPLAPLGRPRCLCWGAEAPLNSRDCGDNLWGGGGRGRGQVPLTQEVGGTRPSSGLPRYPTAHVLEDPVSASVPLKVRSSVSFWNRVGAAFSLGSKPGSFHKSVIDLLPLKLRLLLSSWLCKLWCPCILSHVRKR